MATLIETLIQVLDQECQVFDQLVDVSREKTRVIVANDIKALQEITDKEQDVLTTITNLEHDRERATKDIAVVLGKDTDKVTLRDVIQYLDGQQEIQQRLSKVHDRLQDTVKTLASINEHNATLVNDQLEMIEFNLNVLQSLNQAPETGAYNKGACMTGETYAPLHGSFDSKS